MGRDIDSLHRLYEKEIRLVAEKRQLDQNYEQPESAIEYDQIQYEIALVRQNIEQHKDHSLEMQSTYLAEKLQRLDNKFAPKCVSCKHASAHITNIIDYALDFITFTSSETANMPQNLETILESISGKLEEESKTSTETDLCEWYKDSIEMLLLNLRSKSIPQYAIHRITKYAHRIIKLQHAEREVENALQDILSMPLVTSEYLENLSEPRDEDLQQIELDAQSLPLHEGAFCMIKNDSEYTLGGIFCPDAESSAYLLSSDGTKEVKEACHIILKELEELKRV